MPASPTWNIDTVRSRQAMSLVNEVIGEGLDWDGVLIAHCDTGYTNHIVFNLGSNRPALLIDRGVNFMDQNAALPLDPLDYSGGFGIVPGHGTRTLGALCGNLPDTYTGVCPTVPIVPYRVSNGVVLSGQRILNVAQAIMDAIDRNGASVISISLGVQSVFGNVNEMHELGRAVDHAYESGVIVCGAAGQTEGPPELVGFTVYPGALFALDPGRRHQPPPARLLRLRRRPEVHRHLGASGRHHPTEFRVRPAAAVPGSIRRGATIHVFGCAAMWLRVRKAELDAGGYFGWQRVEAFRAMLRSTFRALKGDDVPSKKAPTSTGILDCLAMLEAKLPKLDSFKKAPLAEPQVD